ncbi:MAG: CoA activase [Candidatus Schekmanbacteria bacterium]|nr:CoA activase [Candidatus Schekmanbacteria bacterium]
MDRRYVGIDIGAETIKVVELDHTPEGLRGGRRAWAEHHKEPASVLLELLERFAWRTVTGAAVTGRFARLLSLPRVPLKQAQARGFRYVYGAEEPATIVAIGAHGFSVLELRASGVEVLRENSRCSQGTGNFLRQLVARFDLSIEEASALCETVDNPAALSGRCPVILKTDMTHLANKGESRANILAGLYDAVCENVQVLIKPRISPPRVLLIGGVSRSRRIREHFARFLARHDMCLLDAAGEDLGASGEDDRQDEAIYLEALGCALVAAEQRSAAPPRDELLAAVEPARLHRVAGLSAYLGQVERMPKPPQGELDCTARRLILGFDIGSTGSKAVALDATSRAVVWEGYLSTNGNPVRAAQALMQQFAAGPVGAYPVLAFGATGSGREIVGSLLSTCYGVEAVYVLNEIAAHAEGALSFDPRVDTIFEIGGQDAKYIRLAEGRVVDAAMNEACSAGTGSFIEEQGRKFSGIQDVVQLGQEAMEADAGVSLGQHCSVFMAEIIDEAVAAGVKNESIIAGIYDSIIQNYLNRVKGSRSVGDVIFCQGMPFSADALAAAVARQTGATVIIPPNPGTVGALGIALLTLRSIALDGRSAADPRRFLEATVESKDVFACGATKGCGGAGNKCKIDRISTLVEGHKQKFTWGGGCSLWDHGTGKRKLPDCSPDPFREREQLVAQLAAELSVARGNERIVLTDGFQLKGLFPFFATFLHRLGFDLLFEAPAGHSTLKRGIEEANVPFCAPMQHFHGLASAMAERDAEWLFLPMLRNMPRVGAERNAVFCPIVQASPDLVRWDLGSKGKGRIASPLVDFGPGNLRSEAFVASCGRVVTELGRAGMEWGEAYHAALEAQERFDAACGELGGNALAFCQENAIIPVVVLGRTYTIYNTVLSSNVPAILREQGAIAIPVDCFEVRAETPIFMDIYWGYGQRNLRAAHQIRRTPGIYSLWCSNYACGPDSFNLHFYSFIMEGRPYAVIETDGHSGDAGTKTRVEAFLHCVREDLAATRVTAAVGCSAQAREPNRLREIEERKEGLADIIRRQSTVLIPRMGEGAEAFAACLRGIGVRAEALAEPDREAVALGRRYTSGKECVPMCITLGSFLQRLEKGRHSDERFTLFMPTANGPCRFGTYNLLHKIVMQRLGWHERVGVWSPADRDYFEGVPKGLGALVFTSFVASDMLLEAFYDARPAELQPGAAAALYRRYMDELVARLEQAARGNLTLSNALTQVTSGRLFGCAALLRRAARDFASVRGPGHGPTVMVVGEIYVRCDPFANDYVVDRLQKRGIRVRFAPFTEWLEYTDWINQLDGMRRGFGAWLSSAVQVRIQRLGHELMRGELDWPPRTTAAQSVAAAEPYVRSALTGEAVLTLGGPLHEWRQGLIDGVVSVGPLECMPSKIAEAQFFHVAEREGLASLTIPVNGDPIDPELLDRFVFEVRERCEQRRSAPVPPATERRWRLSLPAAWRRFVSAMPRPQAKAPRVRSTDDARRE